MPSERYRAVASNPGSDFHELIEAIDYHPRLVTQNPAFALEFVVNPAAFNELQPGHLAMLAAFEETPAPLVELAVRTVADPDSKADVALARALLTNRALQPQHVKHAVWALADVHDLSDTSVYHRQRYQNQPLPSPIDEVERVLHIGGLPQVRQDFRVANLVNSLAPRTYLRRRTGGIEASARWVASWPLTAPEVLLYMGQNKELSMLRNTLVAHPNAPGSMLAAFVGDPWVKQSTVIAHESLPASARRAILDRADPDQVALLAMHPGLPCEEQMELIRLGMVAVLPNLVDNPALCPEAAWYIAALQNKELGLLLLERDDLTDETVEELMLYPHDTVQYGVTNKWHRAAERVWQNKGVPIRSRRRRRSRPDRARPERERADEQAASDENANTTSGAPVDDPGSAQVRPPQPVLRLSLTEQLLVATSRNVDAQTLDTLAGSLQAVVRFAVAAHPNASSETRSWLEEDTDVRVAAAARVAPSLPV